MKKLMTAVAVAAMSIASFGSLNPDLGTWFTAAFNDTAETTNSWEGAWSFPLPDGAEFAEEVLTLEDAENPAEFNAKEAKNGADGTIEITTLVTFTGFDELPEIPAGSKGAIVALTGDHYYVAGLDTAADPATNKWIDTGITAEFDLPTSVKITITNSEDAAYAVYAFGSSETAPIQIASGDIQTVAYTGNGSVSSLAGDFTGDAPATVTVNPAAALVEGLNVAYNPAIDDPVAPGTKITVTYSNGSKIGSGTAVYTVQADGTLVLDEGETKPEAKNAGAMIIISEATTNLYENLASAVAAANGGDTITLLADETLTSTLVVNKAVTLDFNAKTVTIGSALTDFGIKVTVDGATIKNGTLASAFASFQTGSTAICFLGCSGTVKDLVMDIKNVDYGLATDNEYSNPYNEASKKTVVCENVDVSGNGVLFYVQAVNMTLDADCSGTLKGTANANAVRCCSIYSTYDANVTVAGGAYTDIHIGNFASSVVINGGSFGNIVDYTTKAARAALYPANYTAAMTIAAGSFGSITTAEYPCDVETWSITGGTFSNDVSGYVADHYKVVKNDEVYTVVAKTVQKYYANVVIGGNVVGQCAPNNGSHTYEEGADIPVAAPGVWTGTIGEGDGKIELGSDTYFVTNITFGSTTYSFAYDGTTLTAQGDYDGVTISGNAISFTMTAPETNCLGTVELVKYVAAAPAYPSYIEDQPADVKQKYDTWAQTYGADIEGANEDAFLLNCDPKNVETAKANFKITKIEYVDGEWVVEVSGEKADGAEYGNGYVHIYSVKEDFGSPANADFFKAELTYQPANAK